jgi:FkbM family methyltransferase
MTTLAKNLAAVLPRRLNMLDVGARGGLEHPWDGLRPILSATLVEPDAEEAARLRSAMGPDEGVVLPIALWKTNDTLRLRLTKSRGASSVFVPNHAFLNRFPHADRFTVEKEIELTAVTLDGLAREGTLPRFDFAKIDAQGAELAILQGGARQLRLDLVGLQVEVEFSPLYINQPLFSDVEAFVRNDLGLELWDIRRTYWKHKAGLKSGPMKGKLFFRPLSGLGAWFGVLDQSQIPAKVAMLVAVALAYGFADYAEELLQSPEVRSVVDVKQCDALSGVVGAVGTGVRPAARGNRVVYNLLDTLARSFAPLNSGWVSGDRVCGSRRRGPFWIW